ncbi:hypothetical protein [Streptomyces sp. NPDC007206]|uniref:hypothetical protein n=1 Tax=Streptomyces sp. NPDC007206 TaxID=3154317 RepID=UPI0033D899EF
MRPPARWAREEWGPLYGAVRGALRERVLRAAPMTLGAVGLTALLQYVQNRPWGYQLVQDLGAVRAQDPLWQALLRTPLSLFVPALDLPVWGALAQILLVFGIAEACIGWWRTLVIAYAATLAGTLYARTGISLGAHAPFGLPWTDAQVVDTGPSAAVVGLAVYVSWRYGAYVTSGAVTLAMVAEVLVKENLAGKEHLAALMAVGLICLAVAVRHRYGPGVRLGPQGAYGRPLRPAQWRSGSRAGRGSGLPPIQS